MLFFTKLRRHAHEILDEQLDHTRQGTITEELGIVGNLVDQGLDILTGDGPIAAFGEVLHTTWMTKRRLSSKVSTPQIDAYYERARQAGAVGGKLLGAGGGGFLLLFVPPERQEAVETELAGLYRVGFRFEVGGSNVLFDQPS
jgi:D-glycero-alpha-D-manno-heptose-7-phosphate kinase